MKTITSLQSYFIALLILFTSTTVKSQVFCDPDLDPPTFTDCNIGNIVLDIINPTYCYAAVVGWPEPLATDFCTQTQLISSSFDRFFEYYDEGILGLNGQLILHGDDSITIVGTTNGVPFTNRVYQVCYYSTCDGTLSFDFRSRMNNGDGFNGDRARFMIQNAITGTSLTDVLTPPPGNGNLATGSRSYPVSYGDRVCFEVQSDNFLGVNSLTISNLIFTSSAVVVTQISGPRRASHLAPGNYSVVYRATDCAGNSSTCQGTIQVNTAPGHVLSNCSQDTVILLDDPTNCDTLLDGLIPIVNNYCTSFKNFYSYFYPSAKSPLPFPYITKTGPNSDGISGTDGFAMVDPSGDLMIVGTSNGTPPDPIQLKFDTSQVIAHVSIPCRGNATFDWTAMMRRVFATFLYDEAGYKKYDDSTGTYDQVILSVPALANFASGSESVYFSSAGGYLEFYVNSGNLAFRDTLTVSNFVFTPEPTVLEQTCGPDLTQAVGPGVYEMCYEATDCFGTTERCTYELTVRNDFTLGCKDINVSLDSLCTAVITPAMLIAGPSCTATM
ncbi:MAG: hypothetical protein IT267_01620, partial [Saprospiraceae bacterium]|nr:hypothetical protein [Saprospiraceae bacterium]